MFDYSKYNYSNCCVALDNFTDNLSADVTLTMCGHLSK